MWGHGGCQGISRPVSRSVRISMRRKNWKVRQSSHHSMKLFTFSVREGISFIELARPRAPYIPRIEERNTYTAKPPLQTPPTTVTPRLPHLQRMEPHSGAIQVHGHEDGHAEDSGHDQAPSVLPRHPGRRPYHYLCRCHGALDRR